MATEIRFPVEIDAKEAAKELDKLQQKMEKLKESIAKNEAKHSGIAEQLKQAQDEAIQAYDEVEKLKNAFRKAKQKPVVTTLIRRLGSRKHRGRRKSRPS